MSVPVFLALYALIGTLSAAALAVWNGYRYRDGSSVEFSIMWSLWPLAWAAILLVVLFGRLEVIGRKLDRFGGRLAGRR